MKGGVALRKKALFGSAILAIFSVILVAAGCEHEKKAEKVELSGTLRIGGSATVLPLAQAAAEEFMEKNPKVRVEVQGTGSSEGIRGVSEGTLDIGNSSRELKDEEKGLGLAGHEVAVDVIVFVVHPDSPVSNLSQDQVKAILTGEITNWKEVGGKDEKIQVVGRDEASGTRVYVQEEVIGKEANFVADALALPGAGQVKAATAQTPSSFGYIGLAHVDDTIKVVKVDDVSPSKEAIAKNEYPYQRYLHMLTKGKAKGLAKAFIDFVLSKQFQSETVAKTFYPVTQ
jgi:phosphate transport system substrate-binding protein